MHPASPPCYLWDLNITNHSNWQKLSNEEIMIFPCHSSELHFAFLHVKKSCTKNEMPCGILCIVSTPPPTTLNTSSKAFLHVGFSGLCHVGFSGLCHVRVSGLHRVGFSDLCCDSKKKSNTWF